MTSTKVRPSPLSTKSFTRYEPPSSPASSVRSRASTIASPVLSKKSLEEENQDVFNRKLEQEEEPSLAVIEKAESLPPRFDELPVELASLTDRFIESLSTKAFTEPPSIDQIAELFQQFYLRSASNISIHIASLRSKLNRTASPTPSKASGRSRTLSVKASNDSLAPPSSDGSQQMLTAGEVAEKRKQRRLLDYKKLLLEEAVERRACEQIYDKIYRHKSTLDEVEDEKLRSKTAALALVGIGLRDLGIELDEKAGKSLEDIQEALTPARENLMKMNESHYPLGKLEHLTTAHKIIVDALLECKLRSADEILPTLIYTLITAGDPVEGINVVSNLKFIQRFRAQMKIDGEAAYCMTNLEAAIGFLESVDLSTLRADEAPEGPKKTSSGQLTPAFEKAEPFPPLSDTSSLAAPSTSTTSVIASDISSNKEKPFKTLAPLKSLPSPRHQRTLSDILKPVQNANDAVRATAKEGLDNISNTLDNSLKFLFGRLKEQASDPARSEDLTVPKTLDEAKQLVSKPPTPVLPDDGTAISETSSLAGDLVSDSPDGMEKEKSKLPSDDKLLGLFGNRRTVSNPARDNSLDRESLRSNSSSKRVAFANEGVSTSIDNGQAKMTPTTIPSSNPLDAMKNLNPLGHVGNAFNAFGSTFKGFGRPAATPSPPQAAGAKKEPAKHTFTPSDKYLTASDAPKLAIFMDEPEKLATKIKSVKPPIQKFMAIKDADDLQMKDIPRLLSDYQRLAGLLNELASQETTSHD